MHQMTTRGIKTLGLDRMSVQVVQTAISVFYMQEKPFR